MSHTSAIVGCVPDLIPPAKRERHARRTVGPRGGRGARPARPGADLTRAFTEVRFPPGRTAPTWKCADVLPLAEVPEHLRRV